MRLPLVARAVLLALAVIGWAAAPALAAPMVLSTNPEEGAQLHKAPGRVTIEFSEPLDDSSDLEVEDGCGRRVDDNEVTIGGTLDNELSVGLGATPYHGTYTVTYVATGVSGSASDGYTFDVHAGKACDDSGGDHDGHDGDGDGNGDGDGDGHDDHDGDGGGGGGHDDHDGDGGGGDHGGGRGDHSNGDDHGMGGGRAKHGGKHDTDKKHTNHRPGGDAADDEPPRAARDLAPPLDIPTGTTVIVGLGFALLMGALGGWVLRVSSPS